MFVADRSTFIMEGGAISGNSAVGTRGSGGGGAWVGEGSVFTMSGGEISGNSAVNAGGVSIGGNGNTFIMKGGAIFGNTVTRFGGGVMIGSGGNTFIMEGGRIQGGTDSDGFAKNTATLGYVSLAVNANYDTVKWGTGGTYTRGGVNQTGGGNIGDTNDTLIAIPAW
ncbi:MAG: hypothetical protein LBQ94_00415 [Treponema sp.]|nr:hypothetical protein [Treponema sp.]